MNISQIKVLSLSVANQDIAKDFYTQKLGFKLVRDNPMGPNQRWVEVKPKRDFNYFRNVVRQHETWFYKRPSARNNKS
jgi:catechol 2,3-dioxygenase-like lactoylglutathione lyase family enzyme